MNWPPEFDIRNKNLGLITESHIYLSIPQRIWLLFTGHLWIRVKTQNGKSSSHTMVIEPTN